MVQLDSPDLEYKGWIGSVSLFDEKVQDVIPFDRGKDRVLDMSVSVEMRSCNAKLAPYSTAYERVELAAGA